MFEALPPEFLPPIHSAYVAECASALGTLFLHFMLISVCNILCSSNLRRKHKTLVFICRKDPDTFDGIYTQACIVLYSILKYINMHGLYKYMEYSSHCRVDPHVVFYASHSIMVP